MSKKPFEIYPIERVDVYDAVLQRLDGLIRKSGLRVGDRLPPERDLVALLGVSRVSVREALRALEAFGKVEIRRNRGTFVLNPNGNALAAQLKTVAPMNEDFLRHLIDVRAPIEIRVVELVARAAGSLPAVRSLLRESAAEIETPDMELGSLDLRFEAELGRACGNPLLRETQGAVHALWVDAWSSCRIAPGNREMLHREHAAIFDAIIDQDADTAGQLMKEHVDRSVDARSDPLPARSPRH